MKVEHDEDRRVIYQPGDVVGVKNYGFTGKLAYHLFEPQTDLYHFLLIDGYLEDEDDYSIIESLATGPRMGRLSWYAKRDYQVFRVNEEHAKFWTVFRNHKLRLNASGSSEYLGEIAVEKASRFGRHGYDFALYVKLLVGVLRFQVNRLVHGKAPRRMKPEDVPYGRDQAFICTELVFEAWRGVGIQLRAADHAPLPCEFVLAEDRGELIRIDFHNGTKGQAWRSRLNAITSVMEAIDKAKEGETILVNGRDISIIPKSTRPTTVVNIRTLDMDTTPTREDLARLEGPALIARQGGQKRNRVHLYRQPFGYPIRACDWEAFAPEDLEDVFKLTFGDPATALQSEGAAFHKPTCKHCQAVIAGKRTSVGGTNHGHGKGATL